MNTIVVERADDLNSPANAVKLTITHFSDFEKTLYSSSLSFNALAVAVGTGSAESESSIGELTSAAEVGGNCNDM